MTHFARHHGSSEPESKPRHAPRQGWEDAFVAASSAAQDELLMEAMPSNQFDREEWAW
ncbi:MAG: hypothetical protein WCC92_22490 [Candidatus Korobacteraceae bacterium]